MKSPLRKLKRFGLHKDETAENWDHHISAHTDGLTQAAKDMKDMRTCYDGLLAAAAATANGAYEFSESLLELGNSLLEKTAMHDDGETGKTLLLMGSVQHELQKLFDKYRSQIILTITKPSESLLSELGKVEEMKLQCDEKRELFEYMLGQFQEKGRSKHGKLETITSEQLKAIREEYDEAARLFIFRVESLKQGQCLSLLTQAARHHASKLNFFRKGLQSLEAVDTHIRNVAERQHIDYKVSELNYGEEYGDLTHNIETSGDEELSFDYSQNKEVEFEVDQLAVPSSQASRIRNVEEVQINVEKSRGDQMLSQQHRAGSHSAPLFAEKFEPADRLRELRASAQKFNSHVLPTPDDAKGSLASSTARLSTKLTGGNSKNIWHSSPLDINKHKKSGDEPLSSRNFPKSQIPLEENSKNKHLLPLPPPLTEVTAGPQVDSQSESGLNGHKINRQTLSGPLASKSSSSKPLVAISGPNSSTEVYSSFSCVSGPHPVSPFNVSQNAHPPLASSPKVSELHELPRPPDSFSSKPMHSMGALRHSAPLGNRNRDVSSTSRNTLPPSKEGSPLPLPQLTVSRSFSIPSSSQRGVIFHSGKLLQSSNVVQRREEAPSALLTPLSPSNLK